MDITHHHNKGTQESELS